MKYVVPPTLWKRQENDRLSGMERESTYLAVQAKKCPVFDGIGIESLSALFACLGVKRRRLEKGDALMRTGERADRIGILLSGSLSVSAYDLDGRRTIIKRIGPGEIVAAAQALSGADTMYFKRYSRLLPPIPSVAGNFSF